MAPKKRKREPGDAPKKEKKSKRLHIVGGEEPAVSEAVDLTPEEVALNRLYTRLREKRAADHANLVLQRELREDQRKEALQRVMGEERVKEQERSTRRQAEEARDKKRAERKRLKDAKREGEEAVMAEAEAATASADALVKKKITSSFSKRHVKAPPTAPPNAQLRRPMQFIPAGRKNSLVGSQNLGGGGGNDRGRGRGKKQKHATAVLVTCLPRDADAMKTLEDVFRPFGEVDVLRMVSAGMRGGARWGARIW
jgi:hypothetical protein